MSIPNISELGQIEGYLLVKESQILEAKNGSIYLNAIFTTGMVDINAKMWDYSYSYKRFEPGDCVLVKGNISEFRGQKQLILDSIRFVTEDEGIHPSDFAPSLPQETIQQYSMDLLKMFNSIDRKYAHFISCVFDFVLDNGNKVYDCFIEAPAAKLHHQAYRGGLLEHSLHTALRVLGIASSNPRKQVDGNILVAGAILHDIGKIDSYTLGPPIELTDQGKLIGHTALGLILLDRIKRETSATKYLSEKEYLHLTHLIGSHSGKLEWGAVAVPSTIEAEILHMADMIDTVMFKYEKALDNTSSEVNGWSAPVKGLNKSIWIKNK